MATETFSIAEFNQALPKDKQGNALFEKVPNLVYGEHVWVWKMPNNDIRISVRSSIDASGFAQSTGENSIRLYVEYYNGNGWQMVSKGPDTYTTRVRGWQVRLEDKIKELYKAKIKPIKRSICYELNKVPESYFNYSKNAGRPFVASSDKSIKNAFVWMDTI
jgi:hypothetical protein